MHALRSACHASRVGESRLVLCSRFLSIWTILIWTVFPIKFAFFEAGAMSLEADVVIGCICDICAKVILLVDAL